MRSNWLCSAATSAAKSQLMYHCKMAQCPDPVTFSIQYISAGPRLQQNPSTGSPVWMYDERHFIIRIIFAVKWQRVEVSTRPGNYGNPRGKCVRSNVSIAVFIRPNRALYAFRSFRWFLSALLFPFDSVTKDLNNFDISNRKRFHFSSFRHLKAKSMTRKR